MRTMSDEVPISRRLLLGHGVKASFLLPAWFLSGAAQAATPSALGHYSMPWHSAAPHSHPHTAPAPVQSRGPAPRSPAPRLVMLDPGHGGKDPGAIGYSGTYEKQVALAAAQELQRQLEATGRYRVVLTRTRDVFIPLEDRVAIAQSHGAALFVSMHADALNDHNVRGASVYTLANTASDAQTAQLAQRENSADRFGGPSFRNTSPEVANILSSLVRQETRIGSARMAHDMVTQLDQDVPMLQNPGRHAGFVVLKAADIPSVLVEMGFMSNPRDEAALRRPDHRAKVAMAMKRAVEGYFAAADHITHMAG
jgi:N-acetylmuramoyl-L-alanine amidase